MALPENVVGTIEQSITLRSPDPLPDVIAVATARSAALRALHDDLLALMPLPGSEPEEPSLRQITAPVVGMTLDNVVKIAHVELALSSFIDDAGQPFVSSLRVIFTQAVLS
jgi:hypothetical protein